MDELTATRMNSVLRKWHGRVIPIDVFEDLAQTCGIGSGSLEYVEIDNFIAKRLPDRSGYEIFDRSCVRLQFHLPVLFKSRERYGLRNTVSRTFLKDIIQWYWQASTDSLVPVPLEPGEVQYVVTRLSEEFSGVLEMSLDTVQSLCRATEEAQVEWVLIGLE